MQKVLAEGTARLNIGFQGENHAHEIAFDISTWQKKYGQGSTQLMMQRQGDERPYQEVLRSQECLVIWSPSAADTAKAGECMLQLSYFVEERLVKSNTFLGVVRQSLGAPEEFPPDPQVDFANKVAADAAKAENAARSAKESWRLAQQETETAKSAVIQVKHEANRVQDLLKDTSFERKVVESLCEPFEKTGSLIACSPVEAYPIEVVTQLDLVQQGSGVPSPKNPRPIQTVKQVDLVRCGTNLLDISKASMLYQTVLLENGMLRSDIRNGYYSEIHMRGDTVRYIQAGQKLVFTIQGAMSQQHYCGVVIFGRFSDGSELKEFVGAQGKTEVSFTVPDTLEQCTELLLRFNRADCLFTDMETVFYHPMLSTQEKSWEKYLSENYCVPFETPVVSGTLEWNKGRFVSDLNLSHDLQLQAKENTPIHAKNWFSLVSTAYTGEHPIVCCDIAEVCSWQEICEKDILDRVWIWNGTDCCGVAIPNSTVGLEQTFVSEAQKKAAAEDYLGTYTIAWKTIPLETRLSPLEILGWKGNNHLYSNVGTTTVRTRLDPVEQHRKIRMALAALGQVTV